MSVNLDIRSKLSPDAKIFERHAYDNSIIGTTFDGRVIYDFDKMVEELMNDEGWTEEEAIDWIEFNTLRVLPYGGAKAPLVMRSEG